MGLERRAHGLRAGLQQRLARRKSRRRTDLTLLIELLGLDLYLSGRLGGLDGTVDSHVDILGVFAHGVIVVLSITVNGGRARGTSGLGFLLKFLGRDLLCGEETTAWAARASHRMFMAGFVKIWLDRGMRNARRVVEGMRRTFLCLESLCTSSNLALDTRRLRMR